MNRPPATKRHDFVRQPTIFYDFLLLMVAVEPPGANSILRADF
jgi:hypothetical protein